MSLRLFHSALRLRIDLARGAGHVDRGRAGKLLLDLLRGHARIIRVIPIETLVSVPDRRIMARVGEHHGKRRSLGRLDEEDGHIGVRDALRVRPERILPIASAHASVHAEPGLCTPERQPCRLESRKRASHRVERLIPDPIGCSLELPQFSLVETPQDDGIEALGEGGTTVSVGRDEHHVALLEAEPSPGRLDDLPVESAREDVDVRVHQDAAMPQLVFQCQGMGPEVGRDAFRGPVPMAVPAQPTGLLGRDLRPGRPHAEFLRAPVLEQAQPGYQDGEGELAPRLDG